jgi:uncharacterized repeat protein (TIGR02543 family)
MKNKLSWMPTSLARVTLLAGTALLFAASNMDVRAAASLTEVYVPQYIQGIASGSSNAKRVPYAYRVTLSGLTANAAYRYFNGGVISSDTATASGAGNPIFVPSSGSFVRTTSTSLSTSGGYGTFTTDGTGSYTGWFVLEPTGNARFGTVGNQVYMRITLNNGNNGTTATTYLTTTSYATVIAFNTTGANTGTGIYGTSYATDKNFVMLYDNTTGTGRPIEGTLVEADGVAETTANSYDAFYANNVNEVSGAWGCIVPNSLPNGIQRIEQRAKTDGSLVGYNTSSTGTWPSGATTVNPSGSDATPIVITSSDAPLLEYTVTYNANATLTSGSAPTDSSSPYASGATVTVLGNAGSMVRSGYTFSGWNTAANGSGTSYSAGNTFTISQNTTLYAQWTASATYTVTYHDNGSTGGTVPVDSGTYANGATVTVLANTGSLVKSGYAFAGWNTQADGNGISYAATGSAQFTMGSANVDLYAVWTQNPSITISTGSLGFSTVAVNGTSASQSYTVSGANLTANIVISSSDAHFTVSTDNSSFGSSVTLPPSSGTVNNTTIYVRFSPDSQNNFSGTIANSSSGATEQDVAVSGTGALAPAVSTQAAGSITSSGATLNGTVTANNGAAITDRGFYYQTTAGVTTGGTQADVGGTTVAAFSKAVSGLSPNQVYYYRAYAVNAIGTTLDSSDTSFTTLANTPTAPTVGNATTTTLDVTLGSGDGNPSATTYAIQEKSSLKYIQADGTLGATAVYQTAATWNPSGAAKTVTGLTQGTFYTFQVKANNSSTGTGTDTAFGPATGASTSALSFTPGNLVVERLGNGTETLGSGGNTIYMDEFTSAGAAVQSIEIPNSGSTALIDGNTASDGGMTRSADGLLLCFPGYNTSQPYGSSLASSTATAVPRGVGKVSANGTYNLVATSTTADSGNNIRGAATDGSGNYWSSGTASSTTVNAGINYFGVNGSPANVYSANLRCVNDFGGNLWYDTASSTPGYGFWEFSGTPTTAVGNTATHIITLASTDSPYQFSIDNAANPTTLYYADDGASAGGIHKWTKSGGTWSQAYVVYSGSGVYGLVVDWTTTPATIYATTTNNPANSLIKVVDNGAGSSATVLATAPAGEFYRGIAFAPSALPVANAATYSRNIGTPLLISVSDLLTTYTSDANGFTISLTSVGAPGAGTASISGDGKWITYTPTSVDSLTSDSFSYTVNDGHANTASGTVTVNVAPNTSTGSAGTLDMSHYDGGASDGYLVVTMYGIPNYYYDVQRADDVNFTVNLVTLTTVKASSTGAVIYQDGPPPPSSPTEFYRLKYNHQ